MSPSVSRRLPTVRAAGVDFSAVRAEFDLPSDYPSDAVAGADSRPNRRDATDLEFVTIDPPGSMDLDQALVVERTASGFRLLYAIADVADHAATRGIWPRRNGARACPEFCVSA